MSSLDMLVEQDSMVHVIDVFWDLVLSKDLGFKANVQKTGRSSFPTRTLLGIYIYGYLNLDLYGKQVVAIDGSKFRAQNSMKNNFTKKKIERHLEYIETKEQQYLDSLDQEDHLSGHERLAELSRRKANYQNLQEQLQNTKETQISTTDLDARSLPLHMRIVEVSYNLQSAVDDKHNLIVDYKVTNKNDHRALAPMALKLKQGLNLEEDDKLIVLADKGCHTGEQMQTCHDHNIETVVAIPRKSKQMDKTKPSHPRFKNWRYAQ